MPFTETIVAIATPAGRGGIAVVRLSGPEALPIALRLVRLQRDAESHRVRFGHVLDADGQVLDDALLTYFAGPHSYTGEDVVEISTHGAPVVVQTVVQLSLRAGAQLAHAGEFTERAFLNGRLDLTQAEAVRDLIDSSTVAQARLAAEQLGGSLQREVRPVKDALVMLVAVMEAGIDFAEDDLETMPSAEVETRIAALLPPLESLLRSFAHGRLLREGLRLAIVGRPNAGKSSLFNRLLERDRAIVTPIAGTTRDVISDRGAIGGLPVELLDTAGLRETDDVIERIGVERSHEAMADADLLLHVMDASAVGSGEAAELPGAVGEGAAVIRVWNKADLVAREERTAQAGAVWTSAVTGEGMEALRDEILRRAGLRGTGEGGAASHATLTNTRQRDSIARSIEALQRAVDAARMQTPHEMVLLDLYEALGALDALTGQTTADDVLNQIFSTFCIGK
ncbi:tRNA uridine-5-carboxymethylaminomethyl(34) synthesis GTPase MnmE [Terriglobus aquaticus]|uniref:tRNA modification GTPase MnmE n=1 Tax=Terriglobus aquaticus TaxID=940139 RepID=A0ABW9KG93_9BACT|nr:tRNA uridine-5-carboxymethylaminomethyl(34) synthesis GTPase MnmE [Terriglobus aquaticus]